MKSPLIKKTTLSVLVFFIAICSYSQNGEWPNGEIDLSKIETRKDSFVMKQNGQVKGYWIWKTMIQQDEIIFNDISVLDSVVEEQIKMVYNKNEFVTKKVTLGMKTKAFELNANLTRKSNKDLKADYIISGEISRSKLIDTIYPSTVILRPEIFGLLSGWSNFENLDITLNCYFLSTTTITSMNLKYIGYEQVKVPAGNFDTHKIKFSGDNVTSNIIYVNKNIPHNIVRVDVIDQPLQMLLVQSKN